MSNYLLSQPERRSGSSLHSPRTSRTYNKAKTQEMLVNPVTSGGGFLMIQPMFQKGLKMKASNLDKTFSPSRVQGWTRWTAKFSLSWENLRTRQKAENNASWMCPLSQLPTAGQESPRTCVGHHIEDEFFLWCRMVFLRLEQDSASFWRVHQATLARKFCPTPSAIV